MKHKKSGFSAAKTQMYYHSMMIPGTLFLLVFTYIPMFGLIMAFQDFVPAKGLFGSPFVGLKHFKYMFGLPDFSRIVRNTVLIALSKILIGMVLAIAFSILLNEIRLKFFKKSVQTIVYLPHFLSWVVLATVVTNLFNLDGLINSAITAMGAEKINFLGDIHTFPLLIVGTDVWKEFGPASTKPPRSTALPGINAYGTLPFPACCRSSCS